MFTRTSPWAVFIACTLAWSRPVRAQQTSVAHVFLTFDGASDNCTECGQQEFACSYESPFQSGNWDDGLRNFTDPMPVSPMAWIVTQLVVTVHGRFNCAGLNSNPQASVQLGGVSFPLSLPASPSGCDCPSCTTTAQTTSPAQPGGWAGFNYSALNYLGFVVGPDTEVCLTHIKLDIVYTSANPAFFFMLIEPIGGPTNTSVDDYAGEPTVVRIIGQQFVPAVQYRCLFGLDSEPVDAVFNTSQLSTCLAPGRSDPATVEFYLQVVASGQLLNPKLPFTYYNQPVLSGVYPSQVTPWQLVDVVGFPFTELHRVYCSFDGQMLPGSFYVNETLVKCTVPPGSPGASSVLRVSLNGQQFTNGLVVNYTEFSTGAITGDALMLSGFEDPCIGRCLLLCSSLHGGCCQACSEGLSCLLSAGVKLSFGPGDKVGAPSPYMFGLSDADSNSLQADAFPLRDSVGWIAYASASWHGAGFPVVLNATCI